MAYIVIISAQTDKGDHQRQGDIAGIYEDSHQFSPHEMSIFRIVKVLNYTKEELMEILYNQTSGVFEVADDVYSWDFNEAYFLAHPERNVKRAVWKDKVDSKWKFAVDPPKHAVSLKDLTVQDVQDIIGTVKTKEEKEAILVNKRTDKLRIVGANLTEVIFEQE